MSSTDINTPWTIPTRQSNSTLIIVKVVNATRSRRRKFLFQRITPLVYINEPPEQLITLMSSNYGTKICLVVNRYRRHRNSCIINGHCPDDTIGTDSTPGKGQWIPPDSGGVGNRQRTQLERRLKSPPTTLLPDQFIFLQVGSNNISMKHIQHSYSSQQSCHHSHAAVVRQVNCKVIQLLLNILSDVH